MKMSELTHIYSVILDEVQIGDNRFVIPTDSGDVILNIKATLQGDPAVRKYRGREWLANKYSVENNTMQQIADMCDVSPMTINLWLNRHGIPTRRRGQRAR